MWNQMSDDVIALVAIGLFVLGAIWLSWLLGRRKVGPKVKREEPSLKHEGAPPHAILLDGSNVMHWGGDPSALVLDRAIRTLQDKGFVPIIIFDASAGYRLCDRYMNGPQIAQMIGLPVEHVYVVHKGVVADEVILDFAQTYGLRIVTNDRYRDWVVQFPLVQKRGALVRGDWKQGSVVWQYPKDLYPATG